MNACRAAMALTCSLAVISTGCVGGDGGARPRGDASTATTSSTSTVPEVRSAVGPPPGGLVDSAPNFGWTPGEFSVSHDGTAGYTVPLWSPVGRGTVTPQLTLSYNSGAGNGVLGVGWSLGGLSAISWCGRTIAQDGYTDAGHFDGSDALCLDGNRLVPVSPPFSPQREYRTEAETFARIIAYNTQDNVPDYFKMFAKDGTILTFGGSVEARVQPYLLVGTNNLAEPALVRKPGAQRATTGWALDRVEDRNGNAATIEYTRTEGDAAEQWWMELRPAQIRYAPNRTVRFIYELNRPDKLDTFSGGTHTLSAARMSRIEMWGGPQDDVAELLRQYRMSYESNSITGRSLLSSITECDPGHKCKVSLPFEYSLGSFDFEEIDMGASEPMSVDVVDVDGDGRSDLILDDNGHKMLRVALRYPEGIRFTAPKPSGLPSSSALQVLDIDADGRPEVLAEVFDDEQGNGYKYQVFRPTFEQGTGSSFEAVPGTLGKWRSIASSRQPVYLADLDGSGLPDFIGTAYGFEEPWAYRLNTGASGANRFAPDVETSIRRNIAFGNFAVDTNGDGLTELITEQDSTSDPGWVSWGLNGSEVQVRLMNLQGGPTTTHFGDVNGDGLVDSVLPHGIDPDGPRELRVQLNSGNGFGSPRTTASPPGYDGPLAPGYLTDVGVRIMDFNGDGRDDILMLGEDAVYLWGNNAFARVPLGIEIGRPSGSWANTQVLDFDGDGALDLVNVGTDDRLRVFKRLHGVPDRLIGVGDVTTRARTEISYTTLADRAVHTPGTCAYPLTCPISGGTVVASHRVTSDFGPDNEITWDNYRHSYKGARADLHGRGWLGFAEHTVIRDATGATTVTEFDNVSPDPQTNTYPYARLPRTETYTVRNGNDAASREYRQTIDRDYEIRRHDFGTYTVEQRLTIAAEDERPVGTIRWDSLRLTTTETSYDDFGNPDVVTADTATGRTLTQDFDYRNNTSAWLLGLPTRTVSTGCTSDGVCSTRESTFDYDAKGNPTVIVVEPNNPAMRLTATTTYDEVGNVTSITRTDDAGASRTDKLEYHNDDQLYPTATINAAGHRTLIETHSGLGVPVGVTDPNGVATTFRYDRFGRLREANRSDGSFKHITHGYLGDRQLTTTTAASGGETAELVDPLGRTRELRVKTFDGRIATTYTDYDPLGRGVWRTSRPALPSETPRYTATQYDNRGRVTSVTAPDGVRVRHEYINLETHTYDAKGVHSYTIATVDGGVASLYECATPDMGGCIDDDQNSTDWLVTDFGYGPFGEATKVLFRPDGTVQITHYDSLGRPDHLEVPSSGVTKTTYNAFGEIISITDAENRVTTFDEYDALGRVKKKTSPDGVATYTWDTADHGTGKLDQARSSDGVTIDLTYDELGRGATTTWTIEEARYEFAYGYDDIGRLDCTTYPMLPGATGPDAAERLTVGHVYNSHGYLAQVNDGCQAGGQMYWAAEARNGAGQLESDRLGNDVVTTRVYRPTTGLLDSIQTTGPGTMGTLADIGYDYDDNRNVTQRNDQVHQRFETYHYDVLNRLDGWSTRTGLVQPGMNTTYTYSPIGDLKTETVHSPNQPEETTIYRYGEHGAPAHWLTSRNDQEYGYDRTGQQTSGPNRTVQYNTFGLPTVLNWNSGQGQVRQTEFAYDPNGARALKRDADQTVVTVAGLFERRTIAGTGGGTDNLHNIVVDGRVVAQVDRSQDASGGMNPLSQVTYLHNDLQGTTTGLTNHNGEPIGADDPSLRELFYDPFGRRIDGQNDPLDDSRRDGPRIGFTGHEHDDEFGLINMQGRIYDPEIRRFLTPDPIQAPISSQTYNRYSYVMNNPTTLTDPTGFVWDPPAGGPFNPGTDPGGTGPFNPGPFSGGTGPFNPDQGFGSSWLEGILNGSFNATPTPTDVEPTPSSDDDTSSTAADDSTSGITPENCHPPACYEVAGETIYIQGEPPLEGWEDFTWGGDPQPIDIILGDLERSLAQYKSELIDAEMRALGLDEESQNRSMLRVMGGGLLLATGGIILAGVGAVGAGSIASGAVGARIGVAAGGLGRGGAEGWTRVQRWMSRGEAVKWAGRSSMPQPLSGNLGYSVSKWGAARAGAATNEVLAEFEVLTQALKQGGRSDWLIIYNGGILVPIRDLILR